MTPIIGLSSCIEISNTGSIIGSSSKALTTARKNFQELRRQITDIYNQRVEPLKRLHSAKTKLFLLTVNPKVSDDEYNKQKWY
jgi:hypothetical protein